MAEVHAVKLYFVPRTRSSRPRWVLEELEESYELVRMDPRQGDTTTPEHLARHPLGDVPVLEDDEGRTLFESAALCMQLADLHPEKKLAPAPGTFERGLYYQWILFAMTELEVPLVTLLSHTRFLPEGERDPKQAEDAKERFLKGGKAIEAHLATHSHLLGADFTAADVVMCSVLTWARWLEILEDGFPQTLRYIERCLERPAAKRAFTP